MPEEGSLTALTIGLPGWLREDVVREARRRDMSLWALCREALEREVREGSRGGEEDLHRDGRIEQVGA